MISQNHNKNKKVALGLVARHGPATGSGSAVANKMTSVGAETTETVQYDTIGAVGSKMKMFFRDNINRFNRECFLVQ